MENCTRCKGTGITVREAFVGPTGTHWPRTEEPCPFCDGRGTFSPPDCAAIVKAIKGRKGLRSKRPDDARAYYVWRFARFHGGADVNLPMMATFEVAGDPYVKHLDVLAELVAQRVYGTDKAAAMRWAHAMGHEVSDAYLKGEILPPSAQPGGPVADSFKPMSEALELI